MTKLVLVIIALTSAAGAVLTGTWLITTAPKLPPSPYDHPVEGTVLITLLFLSYLCVTQVISPGLPKDCSEEEEADDFEARDPD